MAIYTQNMAKKTPYTQRSSTTNQQYWNINKGKYATPRYANAALMNEGYGMQIDRGAYLNQLNDSARTANNVAQGQLAANENTQYGVMRQNQDAALDTMRRSAGTGGLAGMSGGANSAASLQAALGLGQQNMALQTELANARENATLDYRNQLNTNAVEATNHVDENLIKLMEQAGIRYSVDNDMLGQALNASANYKGAKYTAKMAYKGAKYTADKAAASAKGGGGSGGKKSSSSKKNTKQEDTPKDKKGDTSIDKEVAAINAKKKYRVMEKLPKNTAQVAKNLKAGNTKGNTGPKVKTKKTTKSEQVQSALKNAKYKLKK